MSSRKRGGLATSRTARFDGDRVRVGAHTGNDVFLEDSLVSRFHFQLQRDNRGWRLVDYGSRNGSIANGVRVTDGHLPASGAVVEIGASRLRIEETEGSTETATLDQPSFGELYGRSVAMRKLFAVLACVAVHDANVLIQGESGTGKELVAGEIVRRSRRAAAPFVVVDCGALAPSLVESELFGHARGAFTGADRERVGAFEAAHGGTLLLDEIGELPLEIQPKLLRALEAREVRRLGENVSRKVDVRVLAATHRYLETEVNLGRFREDLFYRLSVVDVRVPPLRERADDIELLIKVFLAMFHAEASAYLFSPEVIATLSLNPWVGNVRELKNYVERAIVFQEATEEPRSAAQVPASSVPFLPYREAKARALAAFEREYLTELLEAAKGNLSRAAKRAQMDRMNLHRIAQRHGLRDGRGLRD